MITKLMRHLYLFLFVLPFTIYSQETDFNNFKTTKAVGEPPSIFTASFQERVEDRKGKRSEEHTSELQSRPHLVCRLLLEKKKKKKQNITKTHNQKKCK